MKRYAIKQRENLENLASCPEMDLDAQIRELAPTYSLTELGQEAHKYLVGRLENLESRYGKGLGDSVTNIIKETFAVRDFYKKLPNLVLRKQATNVVRSRG